MSVNPAELAKAEQFEHFRILERHEFLLVDHLNALQR